MSRTTDQWQKLLEGATPGPWEVSRSKRLGVTGDDGDMDYLTDWEGEFSSAENAALAAAAPEAVAEVVRLRRELEEISIGLERKAERAQRNGAYSAAVGYRETAKKITRILNGESNV